DPHGHEPLFFTFHVLMKSCPGDMLVSSGTFTSATKDKLSQRATVVPSAFVTCTTGCPVAVLVVLVASGADVSVGWDGVGVNAAAVSVNCEITVLAADVRMAATSAVGSCSCVPGDPHAAI